MAQSTLLRAIIAGIVTNFLFLSFALMAFTPLPILFVGLSWGVRTALLAALAFFGIGAALTGPNLAITAAIVFILPGLFLLFLALERYQDDDHILHFKPVDRLLYWVLGIAGGVTSFIFISQAGAPGGLPGLMGQRIAAEPELLNLLADIGNADMNIEKATLVSQYLLAITPAVWALTLIGNIILAQSLSTRYRLNIRPSPAYGQFDLPKSFVLLAGIGFASSFLLTGWYSVLAAALTGLIVFAYFLLGLATIHVLTRGLSARTFLLVVLYLCLLTFPWAFLLIGIFGLLETNFAFRARQQNKGK
ncbi:MAG: DUF2232 domain-containing protein [Parvibaculales bacterium]